MTEHATMTELPEAIAQANNLPSPPTVATKVLMLTRRDDTRFEELAEAISSDPALSAKILKLANSAAFCRGGEVTSLEVAGMRLGMKTLRLVALSFSLTETIPRDGEAGDPFNYADYWRYSLTTAVAGRALAKLLKNPKAEEAFMCGLLGRFGQIVMAQTIPDQYRAAVMKVDSRLPTAAVEREELGYDYHTVGGSLLRSWSLPDLISQTVLYCGTPSRPDGLDADTDVLVQIMNVAEQMAGVICHQDVQKATALQSAHEMAEQAFGISEEDLDGCIIDMEEEVSETASLLSTRVEASEYRDIIEKAGQQLMHISLDTAIDLQVTETRAQELEDRYRELETSAGLDGLTGIANRARFDQVLHKVVAERLRAESGRALGLMILDLDHFKHFNDTYGHQLGDAVLTAVGDTLKEHVRGDDLAARYGGEEFVVILRNTTMLEMRGVAERLRKAIERLEIQHQGETLMVRASFGAACVQKVQGPDDGSALVALADACLYRAKDTGRNKAVCAQFATVDEAQ